MSFLKAAAAIAAVVVGFVLLCSVLPRPLGMALYLLGAGLVMPGTAIGGLLLHEHFEGRS